MKARIIGLIAMSVVMATTASAQTSKSKSTKSGNGKPNVVILATGGTIAGSAESQTAAGYQSGAVGVDILIAAVPQLKDIATVKGEQIASIGSQDMNDEVWLKLGKRVNELTAKSDVDAIVITHGTDTLEETSYFLDLISKTDKPIVMTGSMRPSTAMSADGPLNIYNAVGVAVDPKAKGRGVLVVIDDDIHSAHDVVKGHTTDVATFSSGEAGLIGGALFGKNVWYRTPENVHTKGSELSLGNATALPRVDIIYAHANMSPDIITNAAKSGAKGIVIAGVGDGNMTAPAWDAAKKVVKDGVVLVRSSRVNGGVVRRNIEVSDDEMGTVASMALNPAKARVLLQLALMKTSDVKKIQDYFDRY
jgi:L-asparaginase